VTTSLENKVVLITGVLSDLGRELAKQLLAYGAKVAGTVRKDDQIELENAMKKCF
jgi:NAD(P)-dependent dehydrogenase (short-subunit alcohol dehydrogenase family)